MMLGNARAAIVDYREALRLYTEYHSTRSLNNPDDYLLEIETIKQKIADHENQQSSKKAPLKRGA
jgi:rhodanese-related sulfurtransferase